MINKNKYYQFRNGDLYIAYTKKEIDNLIDLNKFSTWYPYLKDMDYPIVPKIYNSCKNFHKYIATMRLAGYKDFEWEKDRFRVYNQEINWTKAATVKKAVFTLIEDGKYQAEITTDLINKDGEIIEGIWCFKTNHPYLKSTNTFSFDSNSDSLWTFTISKVEEVEHGLNC